MKASTKLGILFLFFLQFFFNSLTKPPSLWITGPKTSCYEIKIQQKVKKTVRSSRCPTARWSAAVIWFTWAICWTYFSQHELQLHVLNLLFQTTLRPPPCTPTSQPSSCSARCSSALHSGWVSSPLTVLSLYYYFFSTPKPEPTG